MKQRTSPSSVCQSLALGLILLVVTLSVNNGFGYQYYSNPVDGTGYCSECHGDFRGTTSTKGTIFPAGSNHEMHRGTGSTAMGTACNLCQSGTSRFPVQIKVSTG